MQLRAAWDQFATGKATKSALAAQRGYGLRDPKTDKLVGLNDFAANPVKWANDYLRPALEKKGIDIESPEFATAIGEISSNRLSSDFIANAIRSWEQTQRLLGRSKDAKGLAGADELGDMSMSASFDGLKASFEDLAAAVVPAQAVIIPVMNSLTSGIKALADAAKDNPILTSLGIGGTVAGAAFGGKKLFDVVTGGFGLSASALALDGSAAALTRAAVALGATGGTDMLGDLPGGGNGGAKGGWAKWLMGAAGNPYVLGGAAVAAGTTYFIRDTSASVQAENRKPPAKRYDHGQAENSANYYKEFHGVQFEGGLHRSLAGAAPPISREVQVDTSQLDAVQISAAEAERALHLSGAVSMDSSALDATLSKMRQILALAREIGSATAGVTSSGTNVGAQMRRNFADRNL